MLSCVELCINVKIHYFYGSFGGFCACVEYMYWIILPAFSRALHPHTSILHLGWNCWVPYMCLESHWKDCILEPCHVETPWLLKQSTWRKLFLVWYRWNNTFQGISWKIHMELSLLSVRVTALARVVNSGFEVLYSLVFSIQLLYLQQLIMKILKNILSIPLNNWII